MSENKTNTNMEELFRRLERLGHEANELISLFENCVVDGMDISYPLYDVKAGVERVAGDLMLRGLRGGIVTFSKPAKEKAND